MNQVAWVLSLKKSTLCEWNHLFDEQMRPLGVPDGRGRSGQVNAVAVRQVVEAAKEYIQRGRRIRLKGFTRHLGSEHGISLSSKTVSQILIANDLYKVSLRRRRPRFYRQLRQSIPNGLVSADGSEFTVWLDGEPHTFNVELAVDVQSFCHTGVSVSRSETSEELIKVLEQHRQKWGTPLGLVADHGSANLSQESRDYLQQKGIELLAVGPGNPKGNGTAEGAFSEMKEWIGPLRLGAQMSTRELAHQILEKVISVYVAMRNRLPCHGRPPEEVLKDPVSRQERNSEKARLQQRVVPKSDKDSQAKIDRIDWIIAHHGLQVDEPSLKRARRCIVTYDLAAITASEKAFLEAIRRKEKRGNLSYFFGILRRVQEETDEKKYREYCRERYHYRGMLERERENNAVEREIPTVELLVAMLRNAMTTPARFIKETCLRQAGMMVQELKKQYRYLGPLKQRIEDALSEINELSLTQRQEAVSLIQPFFERGR